MSKLIEKLDEYFKSDDDLDFRVELQEVYPKLRAVILAAQNVQLALKPNPKRINNVQTRLEAIEAINKLTDTLEAMEKNA
jgi:hypothetical protein